ncbi:MAG: hypothetical protein KDC98_17095 [Planctomycetes bacterium]|nr:hypothetical protein [Planctomycetota bacterium]
MRTVPSALLFALTSTLILGLPTAAPAQTWSTPTAIGTNEVRAVQHHRDGSVHVISRSGLGFNTPQLFHSWRRAGGAFTPAIALTGLGEPTQAAELPLFDGQQFFQLDAAGRAHLVFSKMVAGNRRLWHMVFDPQLQFWSAPFPVTPAGSAPTAAAMQFDSRGNLHLLWTAIPGLGAVQLYHAERPVGGSWGQPTLLSTPGSPLQGATACRHPASSFVIEAGGGLHVFFEQVAQGGVVAQVFHRRLPIGLPFASWSNPVQVSGQGQAATAVASEIDGAGGLHLLWRAIPGIGAPQLWQSRCAAGTSAWTPALLLSDPGTPNMGATVHWARDCVATDSGGDVHVVFDQVPGIGGRRVYQQTYDTGTNTWSGAVAMTPAGTTHVLEGMVIDHADRVHVLSRSAAQLYHSMQWAAGPIAPTVLLSTPGAPNFGADLPWMRDVTALHVAPNGRLHVLFEQVPTALGVARIWHSTLDPVAGGIPTWSQPVDVSGALNSAARIYETHLDQRGEMHVVFGATAAIGAREQLFHARSDRGGSWAAATIVSTIGNPTYQARIPLVPWLVTWQDPQMTGIDYDFLSDNEAGSVDLVFTQRPSFPASETVYHATLDRFTLSVTTTAPGTGDLLARIENVPASAREGFVFLSLATDRPLGSGSFYGLEPDLLTGSSLATPAMPGNPMHWIWPVQAPLFPAAPFALPPGSMPLPAGTTVDFLALTMGPGGFKASNVHRTTF